jgi:toxin ParE1/3/4
MAAFRFSVAACGDLLAIAAHTLENWGAEQADPYLDRLQACCQLVATHPVLARPCDDVRPGYFRFTEARTDFQRSVSITSLAGPNRIARICSA